VAPQVDVGGRRVGLSNLDKVLYPEVGFTKGQVIDYYTRIAPVLLPHLTGRALTMKRYPNGVEGEFFYEKQRPSFTPEWVHTAPVQTGERLIDFILADDLATLVWLGNLADLEMHPSLACARKPGRPTVMAFDLDPGEPATIEECRDVAVLLRDAFAQLGLECFPKTSGSKGMQIYVPLNTPDITYDDTKPFAHAIAQILERRHGELIVSSQKKALRAGKVLIDWSQNDRHKTTVAVYSLRAKPRPTVSTPITWDEVEDRSVKLVFETGDVLERVEEHGDLFEPVLKLEQELPQLGR
jgi:bifunctional non-homologous end joining protein LigD